VHRSKSRTVPRPDRVAIVVPGGVDRSGVYGVVPCLLWLIERLAATIDVDVFALRQSRRAEQYQLVGATVRCIGWPWTRSRALLALMREHRARPFRLYHAFWSGSGSLIATGAARLAGRPSLVHVSGGELVRLPEIAYGGRRTLLGRLAQAAALRSATRVTASSSPIQALIKRSGVDAQLVPLGVDRSTWPVRSPVPRRAGQARLIHVGSINKVKDHPTLLNAAHQLHRDGIDFHLDLVGEDTLHGAIQDLARSYKLVERVSFHGFLPQADVRRLMELAHIHVVSSRHEAGPVALLEAAVCGVPTVGTSVGMLVDWAPAAALSVRVGDALGLAQAIKSLLADEPHRLRIAHSAQQRAVECDADTTAGRFLNIYREIW
jgi:glycosyltransferase involved in cell wall biosynthesis